MAKVSVETVQKVNKVTGPVSSVGGALLTARCVIMGPNPVQLPIKRDAGKVAFTLENVLSAEECEQLMAGAETLGFASAGLGTSGTQTVNTELRDSARLISDDAVLASQLMERLTPFLPRVRGGRWIMGLNEQLKFLRYHPGQKFVAHYDGAFCRPNTENRTYLTVQLYLTKGALAGGATRFVGYEGQAGVACAPQQGRALVFQHNILHEGEKVEQGVKYTIRTDVEYGPECLTAQILEMLGLGGSPLDVRRRLTVALPTLIVAAAALLYRCK